MLDSSCSETPKTKKKTAQNRPVQRFWPDSIASGAAQPAASELTVSEGGHQAGRPRPAGAGEAVIQGQAAVLLRPPWGRCLSRCPSAVQVCPGEWGVRPDARGRPRLSAPPVPVQGVCVSCAHCLGFHPLCPLRLHPAVRSPGAEPSRPSVTSPRPARGYLVSPLPAVGLEHRRVCLRCSLSLADWPAVL